MLSFPPGIQVFMAVDPVDMRKSFDGLSAADRLASPIPRETPRPRAICQSDLVWQPGLK